MIPRTNGNFCSQCNVHLGKFLCLSVLHSLDMRAVPCLHYLHVSQDKQQDCWEINGKEGRLEQFEKEKFLTDEWWEKVAECC